ncbi:MAG TPA: glycosyltransferase family 1 protein [Candidatus Portnoybacteria bacterium]|jgi:glycosyltransferase involved in cell wall biosynthesis|nr:glycosyltransferase family 1 protein [Candidatus Portnoybacteria bacterium]MDD5752227.1 glycosyltransferase family 1 protein [Candidatus Portnoybacteria bacterium]HNU96767.1 glycosyltransferase family 1 protein [Candidatus Portnoybacteria bacterium]HOZ16491.1 glycosyltransferase family 1 protein [Candidatus Portnoybacteria bacterium]HPH52251.1 glycosyltransferase family 1 protein [Candidatus Portnoybacteria bacterium]
MKIAISINIPLEHRTGVEEYIYCLLQNFSKVDGFENNQIFILTPQITEILKENPKYILKQLNWPLRKFWTIFRLSWEMWNNKYNILFVPAHLCPFVPQKTKLIVTIQGLEFEKLPKMYPFFKRKLLRWVTKRNSRKANQIIVPSTSTKNDLIKYYHINPEKIFIIYHGVGDPTEEIQSSKFCPPTNRLKIQNYILYLGRGDKRKNINGLIKAFDFLKINYQIPHKLVLAGPNLGYKINKNIKKDIICTGYVKVNEKWELFKNADIFVFPSFYEGFGIPILEAQKIGTPVVCSNISSMPEIIRNPDNNKLSAVLVNPYRPKNIAKGIYKIIQNQQLKNELIKRGHENVQRFSWLKCAQETLNLLISN